jgi:hypothetical protein
VSKQTNRFTAAVKRAKGLYKSGRYKTFADAIKAAYKQTGGAKKKATRSARKKSTRKPAARKASAAVRKKPGIASARSRYRGMLSERLKTYLYLKDRAETKRVKRHYAKQIASIKRQLKNLS